jgi:hypothetical protein
LFAFTLCLVIGCADSGSDVADSDASASAEPVAARAPIPSSRLAAQERWPEFARDVQAVVAPCEAAYLHFTMISSDPSPERAQAGLELISACDGADTRLRDIELPAGLPEQTSFGLNMWRIALGNMTAQRGGLGRVAVRAEDEPLADDEATLEQLIANDQAKAAAAEQFLSDTLADQTVQVTAGS